MVLDAGTTIGPYEVVGLIGQGGMGEVWQARDTKLDRDVALKVLPEAFTSDPDRLARFEREAKVLASLNHPNIGSIYGLEEAEGVRALVLELVEGPTLADRIKQGPIPVDEALPIAKQIAEALEAAHEQGVIHRDLKPANVKVKDDGTVKVLDFGLAKALDPTPTGDPSQSPTLTAAATQMGVIMGTAAYMSPEQARGKTVDKRADIWAFGCVLYEMLTGRRTFDGEDVSTTLADVIRAEVPWNRLPADLPTGLTTYLRRCLEKDPAQRIRDIGDVRLALEGAFDTSDEPSTGAPSAVEPPPGRRWAVLPVLGALVVGSLLTAAAFWTLRSDPPQPVSRLVVSGSPNPPVLIAPNRSDVAISDDGRIVIYLTEGQVLHVRAIDELEGRSLEGPSTANDPFFSPDGNWVGFMPDRGPLQKVSILGGRPETITPLAAPLRGASWGADDSIVFSTSNDGLLRVSADGGEPEVLTTPAPQTGHGYPDLLPDGVGVLFTVNSADGADVAVLDFDAGEYRTIIRGGLHGRYAASGHVVYATAGPAATLRAVPFDLGTLEVTGPPVSLVDGVLTKRDSADYALFQARRIRTRSPRFWGANRTGERSRTTYRRACGCCCDDAWSEMRSAGYVTSAMRAWSSMMPLPPFQRPPLHLSKVSTASAHAPRRAGCWRDG